MFKDVIRAVDPGILPQIGLIAFIVAFVLIVLYTFTRSKAQRDTYKNMPLDDDSQIFKS